MRTASKPTIQVLENIDDVREKVHYSTSDKQDTHWLDGIRGLAAVTVVVCHCFIMPMNRDFSYWWTPPFSFLGELAVAVFIFLSGYLLALPTVKNGLRLKSYSEYMLRRCNRILPAYWAALAFGIVVALFITHDLIKEDVIGLMPQVLWPIFLLHDIFPGGDPLYNAPLWTLPIEFHIYFFLPLILWMMRRFGSLRGMLGWALTTLILSNWLPGGLFFYAVFGIGAFAAWALNSRQTYAPPPGFLGTLSASGFILSLGFYVAAGMTSVQTHGWLSPLWAICAMSGFGWIMSAEGSKVRTFLSTGKPAMLGRQSYSLYLTHCPIILALTHFLLPKVGLVADSFLMVLIAIPLALVFSRGFWYVFERPYITRREGLKTAPSVGEVVLDTADLASR